MTTTALVPTVEYPTTLEAIAEQGKKYVSLSADTPEGYRKVEQAIKNLTSTRTAIERRREDLKREHLEKGRLIDHAAKILTAAVAEHERPLRQKRDAIDEQKAREKRSAEEKEREIADAKQKAEREAAEAQLKIDQEKLEAERKALDDQRRQADEAARAEREKVAAEQRAAQERIDAQREALAIQERELRRVETERAVQQQAEQNERDRVERENRESAAAIQRTVLEKARLAAIAPDVEKVRAWALEIRGLFAKRPTLESDAAGEIVAWSVGRLLNVAVELEEFAKGSAA